MGGPILGSPSWSWAEKWGPELLAFDSYTVTISIQGEYSLREKGKKGREILKSDLVTLI